MPAKCLRPRPLGSSGMEVSAMSLGSWRTFEHLPEETGSAIMAAAADEGINFFDDARYNDETGRAPLPTGYSEVLFGQLFRAAGLRRDEVVVANKLWWEFWPEQSAAAELDGSLARMGFDHVDVIYANPPPESLAIPDMVAAVGGLLDGGKARAWAMVNWPAGPCGEVVAAASGLGVYGHAPEEERLRRDRAEIVRGRGRGPDYQVADRPVAAGQRVGPRPRHVGQRDRPALGRVDDGRQAGGLPAGNPDVLPQAVQEDTLRRARAKGFDRVRDVMQDAVLAVLLGQQHREHQHAPQRGELFADRAVMIRDARHCLLRAMGKLARIEMADAGLAIRFLLATAPRS